jgi:YYY domain-containing protein
MFMDEGFIAAIMRSPHFPPSDMWYAGQSINYYYYAHFCVVVLAKLLGQSPSIAFNTGICMFFGLTAVNMFGVACNIVSWARHLRSSTQRGDASGERPDIAHPPLLRAVPYGLLTFVMGLVLGNLAATQEWWKVHGDSLPYDWFNTTRVIDKTINEFPAFSFLLSCFHAHVLTLAFTILAIGLAFNLFIEHDGRGFFVFGRGWRLPLTLVTTALVLGGLFAMNGWDFPNYVGLAVVCIALQQWLAYQRQLRFELVLDVITSGASLIALSFLLYLPFYLSFISPAQGIGIVDAANRSPLSNEVLIYGLFAFVFLSLLFASVLRLQVVGATFMAPVVAIVNSSDIVHAGNGRDKSGPYDGREISTPNDERETLASNDGRGVMVAQETDGEQTTVQKRVTRIPHLGFMGVALVMVAGLLTLIFLKNSTTLVVAGTITLFGVMLVLANLDDRAQAFTLLLGTVAFALVALCEVIFLKDVFAGNYPRMNTVFKFYFQSWALLSITSGVGLFFILESFRPLKTASPAQKGMQRGAQILWSAGLLTLILAGAVYPLAAFYPRFERIDFSVQPARHYLQRTNSLDGLTYLKTDAGYPGDYQAIQWLNANIVGNPVIVEAVGPDYSNYGRISVFTGLPTLMGWVGHEYQWRVNWLNSNANAIDFTRRSTDVDAIYTNTNPLAVLSLMANYHAEYLYVGALEYQKYPKADLHRFGNFMQVMYNANGVTIYKVRGGA